MRGRNFIFFLLIAMACESGIEEFPLVPVFKTEGSGEVASSFHTLSMEFDRDQKEILQAHLVDYGFVWSEHEYNTLENGTVLSLGNTLDNAGIQLNDLKSHTRYYAVAYMKLDDKTYYANEISFYTRKGSWRRLADFPGEAIVHGTGFNLGTNGYVVANSEVWTYDPSNDQWTKKNNFPKTVDSPASFVIDNTAYVYCDGIYKYDASADSWEQVALSVDPDRLKGCSGAQAAVVDGKAYIATSYGGGIIYNPETDQLEDPSWLGSTLGEDYSCMLPIDNKAYSFGGYSSPWYVTGMRRVIDPREQKQKQASDVTFSASPSGRAEMTGFVIDGEPYLGLGYDGYDTNVDFYHYNYRVNEWEQVTIAATTIGNEIAFFPRSGGIAFSVGGKGYLGMGVDKDKSTSKQLSDFWEFIPD